MYKVYDFVLTLPDDLKHSIVKSYEEFENNGYIGEEPIRVQARELIRYLGIPKDNSSHITLWMDQLVKNVWRYFYNDQFDGK